jgi:GT2 family glycosyltransferase
MRKLQNLTAALEKIEIMTASDNKKQYVPDLSIVLVGWNNKAYLDPCLASLYESGLKCSFDVVVVDNGSTDGSQDMLRQKYPQVLIIQNDNNVGLGRASNQGMSATKGRYILLLNNDTVVNGRSFDAMVDFLEQNPEAAGVGGKLMNPDGTIQAGYNYFSSLPQELLVATRIGELIRTGYPAIMDANEIKSVDWMGSACLMVRRTALDEVGLLDEGYFIYGDEADLQYRLKKAGWKIYYLPTVTTIHYGGRSMSRWPRRKMVYRGKLLFYQKHYGFVKSLLLRVMLGLLSLGKMLAWSFAYIVPGKRSLAQSEFRSNLEIIQLCMRIA